MGKLWENRWANGWKDGWNKRWNKSWKMIVAILQMVFLLILVCFYLSPKRNYSFSGSQIESEGIYLEDFLGSGMNGFYIDSSFDEKEDFARTVGVDLGPGMYEVSIQYQNEGRPQKYKLDAENADFKLWRGNYHKELPPDRQTYTTSIWNGKNLHNFQVECDYNGDGYILFGGVEVVEKRGWVLALVLACLLLFGFGDLLLFRHREAVRGLNTERSRMVLGGCLFIITFASLPLFSGLLFYGHDLEFHLLRIEGLKDGLLGGQFPVKIQPNWMNGYGYGVSAFYGDLFLYFPAMLRLLGIGMQDTYKCYIFLCNIITCLLSFYAFRKFTGDNRLGLVGSFLLTASVYRLNCIYVRAAVGEYTAMAFMPLYVYGIYAMLFRKGDERKGAWLCTALGFTGIVQSHMISSEVAAILTAAAGVVYFKKLLDKEIWVVIGKCAALILGCNAGFLVPFLDLARESYAFNVGGDEAGTIQTFGATWSQVLNPFPAGRGRAMSISMVERAGVDSQFSYAIGAGFVAAVLVYIYYFVILDRNRALPEKKKCRHFLYWGCLLVFMTTIWFPWNQLQEKLGDMGFLIAKIQFPWRILGIASTILSFFCCALLLALAKCEKAKSGYLCGMVLSAAVICSGYFLADRINDNNTLYIQSADDLDSFHIMGGEYIPAGASMEGMYSQDVLTGGNIEIESLERKYNTFHIMCSTSGTGTAYIEFPLLYYKGYTVQCGEGTGCRAEASERGMVRISVPGWYSGSVDVSYHEAWYWRTAELISAASFAWLLLKLVQTAGKRKRCK